MGYRNLIVRIIYLGKSFVLIYIIFSILLLTALNPDSIIKTASAGSYNGPNYYINSATGNNNNNGSINYPWLTLEYAFTQVHAGDTVYLRRGVYNDAHAVYWGGTNSGTADHYITYRSYPGETAILDAHEAADGWNGAIWIENMHHVRFTDLTIKNAPNFGFLADFNDHNITIDNCTFYNISEGAIVFTGAKDIIIENNIIYNVMNGLSDNGSPSQECISFLNSKRIKVMNNRMWNCAKAYIDFKSGTEIGTIAGNILDCKNNFYYSINPAGIYIDAGSTYCKNIQIYNNVVWGKGTMCTLGSEAGGYLDNISIFNNIYNGTGNGFQMNYFASSGIKKNCKLINNVFADKTSICIQITDVNASFQNFIVRNNIFTGKVGVNIGSDLKLQYQHFDHNLFHISSYSEYYGSNCINGSPDFVDSANGDFHLLSNSPAIDAGVSLGAPSLDYDGIRRPQGSSTDIGAFEFHSASDTTPPTPNPSTWTTTPYPTSSTAITMTATTPTDPSGGIQYYFDETSNNPGATDSGWQTSNTYTDTGLTAGTTYAYRVQTRDALENTGSWSTSISATPTNTDTTPPKISSITLRTSNPLDTDPGYGWVNVSVKVTDNVIVSQVMLRVYNPDNSWINVTMTSGTDNHYYYRTSSIFSFTGEYVFTIWAKDSSNNEVITNTIQRFSMPPNWDINNDQKCDILDLVNVAVHWSKKGANGWIREDVDNDGRITILDMGIVAAHIGES